MPKPETFSIEVAREFVADPVLWPRLRGFLWDFAPLIHASWIEDPASPAAAASPRVKAWVLASLGVKPFFHAFPKEDWSRLALLGGENLLDLCRWLGALAASDALRRVTDGKTVHELKAALPGVYPDVFGYALYVPGLARMGIAAQTPQQVLEAGSDLLLAFLRNLPAPLLLRLKLQLPKPLVDRPSAASLRAVNPADLAKLLKLRFPEAYSLCC